MIQKQIKDTIEQVMPSVVSILLSKHLDEIKKEHHPSSYPFFPAGKHKQETRVHKTTNRSKQYGGGSGFIVDREGLIVTNKHVVADPRLSYTAVLTDGRHLPAEVVSLDPVNDVAILRVDAQDLSPMELGDVHSLALGEYVLAIGNALGVFQNTISLGIVSGLARSVTAQSNPESPSQELRGLIQTDAAINPGNSGGPLVTLDGKVVGINAALISGAQNISLAVPISAAIRDLRDISKYGHIRRPYLGLRYIILDEQLTKHMGLPLTAGAFVTGETPDDHGVVIGSPAHKGGIQDGDVVLTVDNKLLSNDYTFQEVLAEANVGDTITLKVWRNGTTWATTITLGER